jgi:L-ascorbate oxidase
MPSTSPSTFLALAKTTLYSFVLFKILPVEGVLIRETLVFTSGPFSPDNFPQPDNILLINGSFPGPTLYLHQNDTLELLVVNSLPSSFALHMHGLFQRDSLRSDGVPFVTQAPIPPNSSYLYQTQVGAQSGTFMYHAHTDLDLVFAHGLIIIQDSEKVLQHPEYFYEEERLLTLSQCWHVSLSGILNGLEGAPFEDVPDTASLLVNGRSYGIWDENANRTDGGYTVITVRQGAKYRFRVIGLGMDSMLQFKIDNHTQFKVKRECLLVF